MFLNKGKIDDDNFQNLQYVFEMMLLCYKAWLKHDKYWKRDDEQTYWNIEKAIEKLLKDIIRLLPKSTGQEWEIAKMHEQLHVAKNIKYFGAH